ncbi:MAG: hypothetical protein ACTH31_14095, partial [Pseudoclavibacter sp.]
GFSGAGATSNPCAVTNAPSQSPASEPGSGDAILALGSVAGAQGLQAVLYDDGWILTHGPIDDGAFDEVQRSAPRIAPPEWSGDIGAWHATYLLDCQLDEVNELIAGTLTAQPDAGTITYADATSTSLTLLTGDEPQEFSVAALGSGDDDPSLNSSQREARIRFGMLVDLMSAGSATDRIVAATELRWYAGAGAPASELPADWPGPDLAALAERESRCAVTGGPEAAAAAEYVTRGGAVPEGVFVSVAPIGAPACP